MKSSLNCWQLLVAWLSPLEWLTIMICAILVFGVPSAWHEVKKLVNARKAEKTRDIPG